MNDTTFTKITCNPAAVRKFLYCIGEGDIPLPDLGQVAQVPKLPGSISQVGSTIENLGDGRFLVVLPQD